MAAAGQVWEQIKGYARLFWLPMATQMDTLGPGYTPNSEPSNTDNGPYNCNLQATVIAGGVTWTATFVNTPGPGGGPGAGNSQGGPAPVGTATLTASAGPGPTAMLQFNFHDAQPNGGLTVGGSGAD